MKKGNIVLAKIPFSDLSDAKDRPALILYSNKKEAILAFITSNLKNKSEFDVLLKKNTSNKLKYDSVLKLTKLSTLEISKNKRLIKGKLGEVTKESLNTINNMVKTIFQI